MADKGKAALTGAASGAAAGAVLGPWGAAGGAVLGGAIGYFGADDEEAPKYNPDAKNFQYGLGPETSYANREATRYAQERESLQRSAAAVQDRNAPQQQMVDQRAFVGSDGMNYLQDADADARQRQIAALGGINSANADLRAFANRPEGPSAAQALLQQSTNEAVAQQNAYARSQVGGGGAALRQAAFNAGGIQQQANAQASQLRAQEAQAYRTQQLQALGAVQQGAGMAAGYTGQLRGADQGFAQAQAGQANYNAQQQNAYNQYQQGMEFQLGSNNLNANLQQGAQNDAFSTSLLGYAGQYDDRRNQVAQQNLNAGIAMEQAKAAAAGIGSNNFNAAADRGLQETGMMLGAVGGAAGAYGQMQGGGQPAQGYQPTSDVRAKENIRPVSAAQALGGKRPNEAWQDYYNQQRDDWQRREIEGENDRWARRDFDRSTAEFGDGPRMSGVDRFRALGGPDLRPAEPYAYEYKNPAQHGRGTFVGPMAQDLEHLPGVVEKGPDGMKSINAPRLSLATAGAVSEQQKRLDRLEQVAALGGPPAPTINVAGRKGRSIPVATGNAGPLYGPPVGNAPTPEEQEEIIREYYDPSERHRTWAL